MAFENEVCLVAREWGSFGVLLSLKLNNNKEKWSLKAKNPIARTNSKAMVDHGTEG